MWVWARAPAPARFYKYDRFCKYGRSRLRTASLPLLLRRQCNNSGRGNRPCRPYCSACASAVGTMATVVERRSPLPSVLLRAHPRRLAAAASGQWARSLRPHSRTDFCGGVSCHHSLSCSGAYSCCVCRLHSCRLAWATGGTTTAAAAAADDDDDAAVVVACLRSIRASARPVPRLTATKWCARVNIFSAACPLMAGPQVCRRLLRRRRRGSRRGALARPRGHRVAHKNSHCVHGVPCVRC